MSLDLLPKEDLTVAYVACGTHTRVKSYEEFLTEDNHSSLSIYNLYRLPLPFRGGEIEDGYILKLE